MSAPPCAGHGENRERGCEARSRGEPDGLLSAQDGANDGDGRGSHAALRERRKGALHHTLSDTLIHTGTLRQHTKPYTKQRS